MAARRQYEIAFQIAANMGSNFRAAFSSASSQVSSLGASANRLSQELRRLDTAYRNGEMSAEQYASSQSRTRQELDRVTEAHRRLNRILQERDRLEEDRDEIRGKVGEAAAMTVPFGAIGAAALSQQEAMKQIEIQNGLTAKQAQEAWSMVRAAHLSGLGEDVQSTANAYSSMTNIIKNETAGQQKAILQGGLAIEKYLGEDVARTSMVADNMMRNFSNLSGVDSLDIIAAGLQNGLNYAGDYLDTLNEYSPQFQSLGYSAKQFYAVLEAGKSAGAFNLDKVADAIKEFNIRAKDGSKTTADGYSMIGLNANKMGKAVAVGGEQGVKALNQTIEALKKIKDPVKQNQAGVALFGTQWEDVTAKVILSMNVTEDAANKTAGAMQKVVDASVDAGKGTASWVQLGRQIQDTSATLGESLLPSIAPVVQGLNQAALSVANFANEHPKLTHAIITGSAALVGFRIGWLGLKLAYNQFKMTATDVRLIIDRVRNSQMLAAAATKAWAIAQGALNLAMNMNPYLRIALLIAGLVTAGIALYKNFDTVRSYVDSLWNSFKTTFPNAAQFIETVGQKVGALWEKLKGFWRWLSGGGSSSSGGGEVTPEAMERYASGGFANRPSIFGEAGLEAAIPLDGSSRSRGIWERTGEMSGFSSGTNIQVTFAPVIHGAGQEIIPILQQQQRSFIDQLEDVLRQKERVAY